MDIFLNKYLRKCGCLIVLQAASTFDARLRDDYNFVGGEKRGIDFVKMICVYLYLYLQRNPGSRVVLCGAWKLVPGAD